MDVTNIKISEKKSNISIDNFIASMIMKWSGLDQSMYGIIFSVVQSFNIDLLENMHNMSPFYKLFWFLFHQ